MRRSVGRRFAVIAGVVLAIMAVGTATADEPVPSEVWGTWFSNGPLQDNHPITLAGFINTTVDGWADNATLFFEEVDGGALSCSTPVNPDNQTLCTIPDIAAGTYHYRVTYSGNAVVLGSVSEPFELVIEPDTLDATNVKLEYTTFYPYKDGYRDTIHVSGMRSEPISVSIKIYSPTGSLVKSVSVARASGKYSYNWNGRNSAGTIRAAGKYKFVQKLTDAAGTTKTFTLYATLSHKKLVTKTAYVEKPGNDVSAKGTDGSASISVSSSGGSAKLTAGSNAWAGVGYGFSIPTAVVYKSISFQVYAKGTHSVPANEIGLQNFTTCPYSTDTWNEGCFDHWKPIGSQLGSIPTATWYSAPGSVTSNRHSHWIRGMVSVNWGTVTVYKARAKVVYGVLQ